LKRGYHLEYPCAGYGIILKLILKKCNDGVDWIHMAEDREQWRTVVYGNEPSCSIKGCEFRD
jgi:hypothetical protein